MQILMTMNVPYTRSSGGANRSNRALLEHLAELGHCCMVVTPALASPSFISYPQWRAQLDSRGVVVESDRFADRFQLGGVNVVAVRDAGEMRSVLKDTARIFRPDWTLVSSEDPSQALLSAALEAKAGRIAYLALTPQLFPFGPESLYPGRERTELIRQCEAVLCLSQFFAEYIEHHAGVKAHVYHPQHFGSGPFPHFDNAEHGSILLMNASAVKGLPIFLELAKKFPALSFAVIPGYATTSEDLKAIRQISNISVWPNQESLDDIFRNTRLLLMPTLWAESFGLAVVDAMLRGIPALASDHGALPEAKLGTWGLLPVRPITQYADDLDENLLPKPIVPPQDLHPWTEAILEMQNTGSYREQSRACRAAALAFAESLSIDPFLKILKNSKARESSTATAPLPPPPKPELTLEQKALLLRKLKKKNTAAVSTEAVLTPARRDMPVPLSSAQERLFFLDRLRPGNSVYNCPSAFRIRGRVSAELFSQALCALVQRHEVLRTVFAIHDDHPRQIIRDRLPITVAERSLRLQPEQEKEVEAESLLAAFAATPFSLDQGPLVRALLVHMADEDFIFALNMHHIITDGWSGNFLTQELFLIYEGLRSGRGNSLPPLPLHYADYAVWQRQALDEQAQKEHLAFWRQALADAPRLLELPWLRARPRVPKQQGASRFFRVGREITEKLLALGAENNATPFMVLLAAFETLLHRISGQNDIVLGTPVANRFPPETEKIAGFFVNTIPVRAQFSDSTNFVELVRQIRQFCLEAWSHQALPFEKLVECLAPERRQSHSPIFQVLFSYVSSRGKLETPGLDVHPLRIHSGTSKFDLNMELFQTQDGIEGSLEYDVDIFDEDAISGILESWHVLLGELAAHPEKSVDELLLLQPEQAEMALRFLNPVHSSRKARTVVEMFESQAARQPHQAALQFGDTVLCYGELDKQSNQLARLLRNHGVRLESTVGISLRRSVHMVISVLATLKAGAAYVPFDPAYPDDRLEFMLQDAAPRIVIAEPEFANRFRKMGSTVLLLSGNSLAASTESTDALGLNIPVESLAYILFTSGSTGRPKGVQLSHLALGNLIEWNIEKFPASARTLQFSTLNFDVSFHEIFSTFSNGGCLYVASEEERRELGRFPRLLAERKIEKVLLPAVMLNQMAQLQLEQPVSGLALHTIISTAEQLKITEAIRKLMESLPHASLHNDYGPTETHVCTSLNVSTRDDLWAPEPPAGRPIRNSRTYILDRCLNPVRPGFHGELFIAGDCLARGYQGRPDLTAERFLPDPFAPAAGLRMYQTGDLVRAGKHGNIEYLGRMDRQVKVRGMRVEPGEIEAVIRAIPGFDDCLVLSSPQAPGETALVAYIATKLDQEQAAAEARKTVREKLPDYMTLAAFVVVEAFPLTPNGKIDRNALPAAKFEAEMDYSQPRTEIEKRILDIWSELLVGRRIGLHDNFFHLGGHSLLMIRVASRIRASLGVEISLQSFFDGPTVEQQAVVVTQLLAEQGMGGSDLNTLLQQISDLPEEQVGGLLQETGAKIASVLLTATVKASSAIASASSTLAVAPVNAAAETAATLSQTIANVATKAAARIAQVSSISKESLTEQHERAASRAAALRRALLRRGDASAPVVSISALGFPSSNRAGALGASIRSYLENMRKFGRRMEVVVCSDPRDEASDREYRELLSYLGRESGYRFRYAGFQEKNQFAALLAKASGIPLEDVQYALLNEQLAGNAYGTNRNALLLDLAGNAFLSVDDDTAARLYEYPDRAAGIELCSETDTSEVRTACDREEALRFVQPVETDFVGLHEGLLGCQLADIVARHGFQSELGVDRLDPQLDSAFQQNEGVVVASYHGWVGDSGWSSPEDARFLKGESWEWLTRSEQDYARAMQSREQARFVRRLTFNQSGEFLIVAGGIDARQTVPPFMPLQRREDILFGQLIRSCCPDALLAHLPTMVTHGAPNRQASFGRNWVDFSTVLEACLAATKDSNSSKGDASERLLKLGGNIAEIGGLDTEGFTGWMETVVRPWMSGQLDLLEERGESCPPERDFWAADIRSIIKISRQLLNRREFWLAPWGKRNTSPQETLTTIRALLARFGNLLLHWPLMLQTAREFQQREVRLAQPVLPA